VKGFDVYNALEACSQHLEQFGGHMYAAGMTLKIIPFKEAFEKSTETIHPDLLLPEIDIDAEINFADITPKLTRILNSLSLSAR
jgi:single-stranded-DNA-specific exonuclease